MNDILLSISPDYLYFQNGKTKKVADFHKPYFLAFSDNNVESTRSSLYNKWKQNKTEDDIFSKIEDIGEIENYRSFCDFEKDRKVFRVYTKKSYFVPEISDYLFFKYGLFTAEHDIPYHQRALVDISVDKDIWVFDSKGKKSSLNTLVYDIETTEYSEGKENIPIDIIGYSNFEICFESSKNLENEEFSFEIVDCPKSWKEMDITQIVSNNIDEEIDNLYNFCKILMKSDIISGHNILGFDNTQIYNRIKWILKSYKESLSKEKKDIFWEFLNKYSREDKSFHFGIRNNITQFYPSSLDTYLGVRKFYSFLNDFSLKSVAPFLGVNIKDRIILTPSQIKIDERTLKYNKHDVQEQLGVTLNLIQQVLPLSFTTGMSFDMLLSSGAVNMWDHMSLIRGHHQKKIMPPICRVMSTAKTLVRDFKGCNTKKEIVKHAKDKKEQLSKEMVRIIKYGDEMPNWITDPYVIYNERAKDTDERLNYHFPGGMTIKPDKDAKSHFIPWWYVVVADVGAMYPTILKAMNIGADTVRYAKNDEKPDDWIWLKKIPKNFLEKNNVKYRKVTEEDTYADKGYMIGVKIDKKQGVVNCAMTGIMNMISKIKKELNEVKKTDNKEAIQRLKMMYQSVKGARNAGSVDYNQRIALVNTKGDYCPLKIGKFVDTEIEKNVSKIENINGTKFEIAKITDPWYAVSVTKNGKTEIKRVKKVVRHKYNGKLLKITTKSGSTVVTPNHSIFTVKDNKLSMINANKLTKETLLTHTQKIPNIEKNPKVDTPFRESKKTYNTRMVGFFKGKRKYFEDCFAIPPKKIEFVEPTSEYVYDISVEDNENFVDINGGIVLHNTHGIISAPGVSGRQFNLWGAATITTKGQAILADTLNYLENKGIRVVYGDTDGIYLGCSKSMESIPDFSKKLDVKTDVKDKKWITKPDTAFSAIEECNNKWRKELNYPEFELEPEEHDAMIFVKHKNYLIFDSKNESIDMITKGNNFKGSDKANIARIALKKIMMEVLKEIPTWSDEEEARKKVRDLIGDKTREIVSEIDLSKVDIEDLTLIQSVQPANRYKPNQNGSMSTFGKRAAALEKVLGEKIKSRVKFKFVVTKKPLPGIQNPSKSGVKPIDYMYPVDLLEDKHQIDLDWYKEMIQNYIKGAFGLSDIAVTEQTGLDSWM